VPWGNDQERRRRRAGQADARSLVLQKHHLRLPPSWASKSFRHNVAGLPDPST
jgi:hypothetical protein